MPSRLLVIDDDATALYSLSEALKLRLPDFAVDTASTAERALVLLATTSFDLILSDIKMPGMDGLTFLREVKALRPECPVILITGFASDDIREQALRLGATGFMEKPIPVEKLISSVAAVLNETPFAGCMKSTYSVSSRAG